MTSSYMLQPVHNENPVLESTPWELYDVDGCNIYVKREDLCSPHPGPQFSKIRGLYPHMKMLHKSGIRTVGILDTIHSKAGWSVAYCGNLLGMRVFDFYPVNKALVGKGELRYQQQMAQSLGAVLVPLAAGAGYILEPVAKKLLEQWTGNDGVMLPVGLKLPEAIEYNAREVIDYTPRKLLVGSWIVASSSGTIASGIWKALRDINATAKLFLVSGYKRPEHTLRHYIAQMAGYPADDNIVFIDPGYAYKDAVEYDAPFPCNPYYDLKAWKWLMESDLLLFKPPLVFWNIGA